MSHRADPQGIYLARRIAIRNRLLSEGVSAERAEQWLAAWEARSPSSETDRYSMTFWQEGGNWIDAEREAKRKP